MLYTGLETNTATSSTTTPFQMDAIQNAVALGEIGGQIDPNKRKVLCFEFIQRYMPNEDRVHVLMARLLPVLAAIPRPNNELLSEAECMIAFGKSSLWQSLLEYDAPNINPPLLKLAFAECSAATCSLFHHYQNNNLTTLPLYAYFNLILSKVTLLTKYIKPLTTAMQEKATGSVEHLKEAHDYLIEKFPQFIITALLMLHRQGLKREALELLVEANKYLLSMQEHFPSRAVYFEEIRRQMQTVSKGYVQTKQARIKSELLNNLHQFYAINWPRRYYLSKAERKAYQFSGLKLLMATFTELDTYLREWLPFKKHPLFVKAAVFKTALSLTAVQALKEATVVLTEFSHLNRRAATPELKQGLCELLEKMHRFMSVLCEQEGADQADTMLKNICHILWNDLQREISEDNSLLKSAVNISISLSAENAGTSNSATSSSSEASAPLEPAIASSDLMERLSEQLSNLKVTSLPQIVSEHDRQAAKDQEQNEMVLMLLRTNTAKEMAALRQKMADELQRLREQKQLDYEAKAHQQKQQHKKELQAIKDEQAKELDKINKEFALKEVTLATTQEHLEKERRTFAGRLQKENKKLEKVFVEKQLLTQLERAGAAQEAAKREFTELMDKRLAEVSKEHHDVMATATRLHNDTLKIMQISSQKEVNKLKEKNKKEREEQLKEQKAALEQEERTTNAHVAALRRAHAEQCQVELEQNLLAKRIRVPENVKKCMAELAKGELECYMAGLAVYKDVLDIPRLNNEWFEIIVNSSFETLPPPLKERLIPYQGAADYYILDEGKDTEVVLCCQPWQDLATYLVGRDFSLDTLLCDSNGKLIDIHRVITHKLCTFLTLPEDLAKRLERDPFLTFRLLHTQTAIGKPLNPAAFEIMRAAKKSAFHLPFEVYRICLLTFFINSQAVTNLDMAGNHRLLKHLFPTIQMDHPLISDEQRETFCAFWREKLASWQSLDEASFITQLIAMSLLMPVLAAREIQLKDRDIFQSRNIEFLANAVHHSVDSFFRKFEGDIPPNEARTLSKAIRTVLIEDSLIFNFLKFHKTPPKALTPLRDVSNARLREPLNVESKEFVPLRQRPVLRAV